MNSSNGRRSSTHYFGADSWQTRHDACLRIQREIATSLADRDRLPTTSHRYTNLNEQILQRLKVLGKQIDVLKDDLNHTQDKSITSGERSRRQEIVESLIRAEQELRFSMTQSSITKSQRKEEKQRKELLTSDGGGVADLGEIHWGGVSANKSMRLVSAIVYLFSYSEITPSIKLLLFCVITFVISIDILMILSAIMAQSANLPTT